MKSASPSLSAVTARLEKLESENRRLKLAANAGLLLVSCAVLMGRAAPKIKSVEGEEFVLREASGNRRAVRGFSPDFSFEGTFPNLKRVEVPVPTLTFHESDGQQMTALGMYSLEFMGQDGSRIASLSGSLLSQSKGGQAEVVLGVTAGMPNLMFKDDDGDTSVWLTGEPPSNSKFPGGFYLNDTRGKSRASLTLEQNGAPSLTLTDENGKSGAVLGAKVLETVKTGETTTRPPSSLILFDKEGKVL